MKLGILLTFCLLLASVSAGFGQPKGRRAGAGTRRLDGKGGDVRIAKPRAGAAQGQPIRDGTSNTVKPEAARGAGLADDTVGAGVSAGRAKPVTDGTSNTVRPRGSVKPVRPAARPPRVPQ